MKPNPRIFIGLREVAGYFGNLNTALQEAGATSAFMNLGGNRFGYSEGENPGWVRFFNRLGSGMGKHFSKNFFLRLIWLLFFQTPFSWLAFHIAIFRYDVFIMGSNSSFFFFAELPILKLFRKKIIYVFLGTDSRPLYLNGYVAHAEDIGKGLLWLTAIQKMVLRITEHFADHIVNHPPQSHFHRRSFVQFLCLGIPFDLKRMPQQAASSASTHKTRILHAPSKAGPKGSSIFRKIVETLKSEGFDFDYIEISGLSNSEVLKHIENCDIILDEMYSDTPMAVFAAEAAFCGKPALVGSYYSRQIMNDVSADFIPPSFFILPEEVEATLRKLLTEKERIVEKARLASDFVKNAWQCRIVGEKYLRLISGDIPKEWMFEPLSLRYTHGCGLSESQARHNIRAVIAKGGVKALRLKHNPDLENMMVKFAEEKA